MPDREATAVQIADFLSCKRLALAGVSRNPRDFSRRLMQDLIVRGYEILPVNPNLDAVEGVRCFPRLTGIHPAPETALLMTSTEFLPQLATDCAISGVKRVWLLASAGDKALRRKAITILEENLIEVIDGQCPYMFLHQTAFPHRLHRGLAKLFGSYPK